MSFLHLGASDVTSRLGTVQAGFPGHSPVTSWTRPSPVGVGVKKRQMAGLMVLTDGQTIIAMVMRWPYSISAATLVCFDVHCVDA